VGEHVGNLYEQIFIVRKSDHAGWNTYEIDQPAGFILPVVKYRTNGVDTLGIAAASADPASAGAAGWAASSPSPPPPHTSFASARRSPWRT
jgi:hypothetical protein